MRSNIKINYSVLKDIIQKTYNYKTALEEMDEAINNINIMLEEKNSGEAIDALKESYEDLKSDLESCHNEVSEIYKIFDEYITEMTSIIRPKNESISMTVGRTDIYMNMETIIGDCYTEAMIKSNAGTYRSFPNFFESDEEKENAKNNYNKVQEIWQIIRRYQTSLNDNIDDLNNLFNSKVVAYEDMDDTFKGRASQLYDEQSTIAEKVRTNVISGVEDRWNEARGFFTSVKNGIIGLGELLTLPQRMLFNIGGAALGYLWISATGDAPDFLQDCIDTVDSDIETARTLLKDPMLLEESIAQGILDAYENEGLAYCTGYIEGEIAQILALDALGDIAKTEKVTSETSKVDDVVSNLKFKEDYYIEHTIGPVKKFSTRVGISGGHNYDEFMKYFSESEKYDLGSIKINESNIDGIFEIEYKVKVAKKDYAGNLTGEFKDIPNGENSFYKTVYNPAKISNEEIIKLSKEAMNEGVISGRIEELPYQSSKVKILGKTEYKGQVLEFEGYRNLITGEIENAYPVFNKE